MAQEKPAIQDYRDLTVWQETVLKQQQASGALKATTLLGKRLVTYVRSLERKT